MVRRLELEMEVLAGDGTDDNASTGTQDTASGSTADILDCVTTNGYAQRKLSSRGRTILATCSLLILCAVLYLWNADMAAGHNTNDKMKGMIVNKYSIPMENNKGPILDKLTTETESHEGIYNSSATISVIEDEPDPASLPDAQTTPSGSTGQCSTLCGSRQEARKTKFGGDLYDLKDVLIMANKGRDKLINDLKKDYGEQYFEGIFVKPKTNATQDDPPSYYNMNAFNNAEGQSRRQLRRKLQLKVLKMIESLKISEESVHGCNCRTKDGNPTENEEKFKEDIPDHYQKYVFANGGHSQAAGHGNTFSQTYTAYLGQDLRTVWNAIGVEMIDRNMGMGGMYTFPQISACSKETFGTDVDLLAWYYSMTDKDADNWLYYIYRAAITPGRPAFVNIDAGRAAGTHGETLAKLGLSIWTSSARAESFKNIPDSTPDGIPLVQDELDKLPPMLRNFKCNSRFEGKPVCFHDKWFCTPQLQQQGKQCTCPKVGKRASWHSGYRHHALQGHFMALPIVEILLEGINELVEMDKDPETLLEQLQAEEDEEFEKFLSYSPMEIFPGVKPFREPLGDEHFDNFFKGPSICRTSILPAMSRYLGLTTNSDKVGDSARCGEETYDTAIPVVRKNGMYTYVTNRSLPAGEIHIEGDSGGCPDVKECSDIVMPDYKDWFMGNWTAGSASITFPNKKEREYYGYDKAKFKGIIGVVPTLWTENYKYQKQSWRWNVDIGDANIKAGNLTLTVNGERVTSIRSVRNLRILEGPNGVYWKPSANNDYVFEFKPHGDSNGRPTVEGHLRFQGFVLY